MLMIDIAVGRSRSAVAMRFIHFKLWLVIWSYWMESIDCALYRLNGAASFVPRSSLSHYTYFSFVHQPSSLWDMTAEIRSD